jgi:multidrug efflux pump
MNIFEFFIRRPVFSTVLSLILILIGIVSYSRLTVREYPSIDEPTVSVSTNYPGASATIVEAQVTQVLENSIAGIEGIDILESTSRSEGSRITVRFRLDVDPEAAANDVRDRVSRVRRRLPPEIQEPNIAKVEADAQAMMYIVFRSERMSSLEVTDYVDRYVVDRLKNLGGIADVTVFGARRYAMRIWVDRERLAAYNLTVQDIESALRAQNVELPSGRIESTEREFTVLSRTGLTTPEQFGDVIVKLADRHQVKLREVARVELGAQDERRANSYNGGPAIVLGVIRQATANPLDVSAAVRAALPDLNQSLPEGLSAEIGNDTAVFINRSIRAVFLAIAEALVLVVLVIFFFLRSVRASVIPIITIPISLTATFGLMFALGFSINTLTLLAMVLAIGIVVDDAIVVLENIYRYIEKGMTPVAAAIRGIKQIGFAVISMTLTLSAVYAPVAFASGRTGRLFLEFALTLAGAVLVSGFVALTLTPMMCSKLLRHNPEHGRLFSALERGFTAFDAGYRRWLTASLRMRPLVLAVTVLVAALAGLFFYILPSELAPTEDRGVVMVRGSAPEGATLAYTNRYAQQAAGLLADVPEMASRLTIVGSPDVSNFIAIGRLKDWSERDRKQQALTAEIGPKLRRIPGVNASANNPPSLGVRGSSRPVEVVIQGTGSYEDLQEQVEKLLERLEGNAILQNIDTDLRLNKPEIKIEMNREKVADLGLDVSVVGRTLETLLGGRQVTRFEMNGRQRDVFVQLAAEERDSPSTLATIFLRGPKGDMIQLSNVVTVNETVAPRDLRRFNQMRAVTVSAHVAPGYTLGEGLAALEQAAREVLPSTITMDVSGQSREFRAAGQSLAFIFVLALAFIYLVLSAQFESFRDPLIIMATVPLSILGALAALYFTGGTLNVFSQIGLVTLVGLITRHGILIVEFANQQQESGKDRLEAVIEAASLRLRPILMTTGATALGALPLALAFGAGAESRHQIGWVIVGGMTFGTMLTLFVIPTVYSYIGQRHGRMSEATEPVAIQAPAE